MKLIWKKENLKSKQFKLKLIKNFYKNVFASNFNFLI